MHIAQLRGVTRKLGVSHLTLRPDGVHMRMDEKFLPDPPCSSRPSPAPTSVCASSVGKVPELILASPA